MKRFQISQKVQLEHLEDLGHQDMMERQVFFFLFKNQAILKNKVKQAHKDLIIFSILKCCIFTMFVHAQAQRA